MLRFLSHMFIAAVLAPAAGGAVYVFCHANWQHTTFVVRVFGSLMGGFVLLSFVWFATLPFGLLTSVLCFAVSRSGGTSRALWMIGGAGFGLLSGQMVAVWAHIPVIISLGSGVCIGAVSGVALREVWCYRKE